MLGHNGISQEPISSIPAFTAGAAPSGQSLQSNTLAAENQTWRSKQRGFTDLPVNIAVMVVAATVVTRAPTIVTAPWKKSTQIEQSVNIAARVAAATPNILEPTPEPVSYKRPAAQPDVLPNLAVSAQAAVVNILEPTPEPTIYKRGRQPDVDQNRVVHTPVTLRPIPQLADQPARKAWSQPDLSPNLAALVVTAAGNTIKSYEWIQPKPKAAAAPDLFPNLAVRVAVAATIIPAPAEPTYTKRLPPQIELFQNIASRVIDSYVISGDDAIPARRWPSMDLLPNLSVNAAPPAAFIRPYPEPAVKRQWIQAPDVLPNLAINFTPPAALVIAPVEPTIRLRIAQKPDLYPNIAVNFPQVMAPQPADWQPPKRYAPQVEVFQNQAIYAAVQAPYVPPLPIEPTISVRYPPQVIEYPNLVIGVPYTPPVVVPPVTTQTPAGRHKYRRYYVEIDGQQFQVDSVEDAVEILEKAKQIAQGSTAKAAAAMAVRRAVKVGDIPQPLRIPRIRADKELEDVVISARKELESIYANALLEAELKQRLTMRKREEDDDDDDLLLLL